MRLNICAIYEVEDCRTIDLRGMQGDDQDSCTKTGNIFILYPHNYRVRDHTHWTPTKPEMGGDFRFSREVLEGFNHRYPVPCQEWYYCSLMQHILERLL